MSEKVEMGLTVVAIFLFSVEWLIIILALLIKKVKDEDIQD